MPKDLDRKFLHKFTKHTNLYKPHSEKVSSTTFPEQISELLNTIVTLKYRDHRIGDKDIVSIPSYGRPKDDGEYFKFTNEGPDKLDPHDIYTGDFKIIRADKVDPFRMIAISTDYDKIIISTTKQENGNYIYPDIVCEYPIQMNEYIGIACFDKYNILEEPRLKSVTLRVDTYEPCYSVLMEILGSTGYVRFLLGDETEAFFDDYYDTDGSKDYNAKDASEYDNPTDVDGYKADHRNIGPITDVNGGPADNFAKMYDSMMNDEDIKEFRKETIERYKIYGAL